jgi:hypothetical protein
MFQLHQIETALASETLEHTQCKNTLSLLEQHDTKTLEYEKMIILNGNRPVKGYSDRAGCYTVSLGV